MPDLQSAPYRRGRLLYIAEAAFEYLISILVAGSYLATLTNELGFSDSLTGIVSSFISLGCLFQLLSVVIRPRRVKGFVVVMSVLNQLLFLLLYVIPVFPLPSGVKTAVFVAFIFIAYIVYNMVHPKKINWLMSLVDDSKRGTFTAHKEIISLIAGMAFSFGMGALIDHFKASDDLRTALVLSAVVIGILMLLHTLSMLFTIERDTTAAATRSLRRGIQNLVHNKHVGRIMVVFVLYYIAHYAVTPFYGTYFIKELGFSLTFVSALTIASSVTRIAVSRFWGRYADKSSFAAMIEKCLLLLAVSYVFSAMAVPSNGKIMIALYYVFHGAAMGGINSALTNMIFDYVPYETRADSLAVTQAAAGLCGFLTTLCASPLVAYIQQGEFPLYAQQVMTIIGLVFVLATVAYVRFVILPQQRRA